MTTFVYHSDDHEVRVYPADNLDTIEVPDGLEDEFIDYVDEGQPTLYELQRWLDERAALVEMLVG